MPAGYRKNAPQPQPEHAAGVIIHITDQGATSPDPAPCDLDRNLSSALGGGSSTRSSTASGPDPAEDVS
jgi:hypothetical protein